MTIGERIKARRMELGMSQEELAAKIGYKSRSSINKIELDQYSLRQSKIKAIADALETSPLYIMGWEEDPAPSAALCQLFEQCHGEDFDIVQALLRLDHEDRLVIFGEIRAMLRAEKYQGTPGSAAPA